MIHGETVQSPLPQDLPWWNPDHAVFFAVLYIALGVIGVGMIWVIIKSWVQTRRHT
jgi:hypothetical protein